MMKDQITKENEGRCPDCGGPIQETGVASAICLQCGAELVEKRMAAHIKKINKLFFPARMLFVVGIGAILILTAVFSKRGGPSAQTYLENQFGPFLPVWAGPLGLLALCVCQVASAHLPKSSQTHSKLAVVVLIATVITIASWHKMNAAAAVPLFILFMGAVMYRIFAGSSQ
jgi:hypothetical protein